MLVGRWPWWKAGLEEAGRIKHGDPDAMLSNKPPTLIALATPIKLTFYFMNHGTPRLQMFLFSH